MTIVRNAALRLAAALVVCGAVALAVPHRSTADTSLGEPFDPSRMNRSANACANFFDYATATWRRAHPIPAAYSEYGVIEELVDRTRAIVRSILENAQKDAGEPGSTAQKIGDFYASCTDEASIERNGLKPIAPELARIVAVRSRSELVSEIARLQTLGIDVTFAIASTQDFHDTSNVIAEVDQAGIGLPERDYYLRSDAESRKLRARYRAHVATMLKLSGDAAGGADANTVVAFETELARGSKPAADLRDPAKNYHPYSVAGLGTLAPHLGAATYLRSAGVPNGRFLNVAQPGFVRTIDAQLVAAPLSTWRAYLRWRLIDNMATALPARFDREAFAFNGRILNGTKEQLPRWKRCVTAENALLGEAVGKAYVVQQFSAADKADATGMSERIRAAYHGEMASLPWMTPGTKTIAQAKLSAMGLKVGYPDRWRSYAGYVVTRDYFANTLRGRAFARAYDLGHVGKPVDRSEWGMSPQTVNAYNDTLRNEIVLPAAQLQKPFYDASAPDADNLGATGAGTVGHEMTHGFDDEGHKFDLHGNLRNWWTARDLAAFDAKASCVIKQFDNTVAVGNVHYQGRLVAGEAIADLGGVVIGYRALEASLAGKAHDKIDGSTPEQRYFLAFAQSWTESNRPEAARTQALGDPHPLPRDRVNVTLSNVPEWYAAFNCAPPPKPVCSVW